MSENLQKLFDADDLVYSPTVVNRDAKIVFDQGHKLYHLHGEFSPKKFIVGTSESAVDIKEAIRRLSIPRQEKAVSEPAPSSIPRNPPALAEFVLGLVTSDKMREAVLGDYDEEFYINSSRIGVARARRIYWAGVLHSVIPLIWSKIREAGVFGLLAQMLSR